MIRDRIRQEKNTLSQLLKEQKNQRTETAEQNSFYIWDESFQNYTEITLCKHNKSCPSFTKCFLGTVTKTNKHWNVILVF